HCSSPQRSGFRWAAWGATGTARDDDAPSVIHVSGFHKANAITQNRSAPARRRDPRRAPRRCPLAAAGRRPIGLASSTARLDPPTPATSAMRYSIGSISKQFTATAVLLLAERHKLSLDDKIAKWLPDLTRANEVTLRQVLSMTSGYQDYWPQDYVMPPMLQPTTARRIVDEWAKKPLDFEPGTKWQYSNTNYVIAGMIVEKVAGMPLVDFLRK